MALTAIIMELTFNEPGSSDKLPGSFFSENICLYIRPLTPRVPR